MEPASPPGCVVDAGRPAPTASRLAPLTFAALGVVYGDIGTSPLYTIREAFGSTGGLAVSETTILGVLSLIVWSLILIVTLKYVVLVLRADNRGEGGVLSLATLAFGELHGKRRRFYLILAFAGMALLYGDGLITPAISVLGAAEGLEIAAPGFAAYVVPLSFAVLLALFLVQYHGTARVGALFGPIMVLWFVALGLLGAVSIAETPEILRALDPRFGLAFAASQGWHLPAVLGAVVLAVTGAEALYADMGHFGARPIRVAWYGMVLPGLLLNYFGQGALLLRDPEAAENPFMLLAPGWALLPLVVLATAAAIIASQAVISGVFSLTRQAVQLGYLPRMEIRHTSESEIGQVYIPRVNLMLMLGVLYLVATFQSSSALAAAYGIAVTGTMAITAIMGIRVARTRWHWPWPAAWLVFGLFLIIDLMFMGSNLLKVPEGGWFTLAVAFVLYLVVITWRKGRRVLYDRLLKDAPDLASFLVRADKSPVRIAGTAVFMTPNRNTVPQALLHNLKHNKVLHERVVVMTVQTEETPTVAPARRLEVEKLGKGFFTLVARYGYMERPDVPRALTTCRQHGLAIDMMETSFFFGRETLVRSQRSQLNRWQEELFRALTNTAMPATAYFSIPPNRVMELGAQIDV